MDLNDKKQTKIYLPLSNTDILVTASVISSYRFDAFYGHGNNPLNLSKMSNRLERKKNQKTLLHYLMVQSVFDNQYFL